LLIVNRIYSAPTYYSLFLTCHTHGWINLAPYSWDNLKDSLEFALLFKGQAVDVSVQQHKRSIRVSLASEKAIRSKDVVELDTVLARILDLGQETTELMTVALQMSKPYHLLIKKGAGRLLRGASLWEDAAKTLFTTNCSWALTQKMCERACSANYSILSPKGRYPFPSPSSLANERVEILRKNIPIGYRADYLRSLACVFSEGLYLENIEITKHTYEEAYQRISKLKGFGPYARTHLMVLMGYYERIPIDSEVTSFIRKRYKCGDVERFVNKKYSPWGKYKWWGLKFEKMLLRQNWLGD